MAEVIGGVGNYGVLMDPGESRFSASKKRYPSVSSSTGGFGYILPTRCL